LGTLGPRSGRNLRVAEAILQPAGIQVPYFTDGGNLAIEFTIIGADNVRGATQVFTSDISFAFGTYPLEVIPTAGSVPPDGGGGLTAKQLLLEQMLGFWVFQYTIISQFEDSYANVEVIPSTVFDFVAVGVDEFFNPVLIIFDDVTQEFFLFDEGTFIISTIFSFNFNANGTISGCYFQTDIDFSNPSSCFPMTGEKADLSTVLVSPPPLFSLSNSRLPKTNIESLKLEQARSVNSTNTAGLLQSKNLNLERVIERFRSSEIGKKLLAQ